MRCDTETLEYTGNTFVENAFQPVPVVICLFANVISPVTNTVETRVDVTTDFFHAGLDPTTKILDPGFNFTAKILHTGFDFVPNVVKCDFYILMGALFDLAAFL